MNARNACSTPHWIARRSIRPVPSGKWSSGTQLGRVHGRPQGFFESPLSPSARAGTPGARTSHREGSGRDAGPQDPGEGRQGSSRLGEPHARCHAQGDEACADQSQSVRRHPALSNRHASHMDRAGGDRLRSQMASRDSSEARLCGFALDLPESGRRCTNAPTDS